MALIEPESEDFLNHFGGIVLERNPRIVSRRDVRNLSLKVLQRIDTGEPKTARLTAYHFNEAISIKYKGGKVAQLLDLLELDDPSTSKAVSEPGDSGALIYDEETNQAVGMIIGGNNRFSYAIPISKILEQTDTQIFTTQTS